MIITDRFEIQYIINSDRALPIWYIIIPDWFEIDVKIRKLNGVYL